MSVNNSILPFPDWASLSYDGNILISSSENLHIPFAFVKAAKLVVVSDSPRPNVSIIATNYSKSIYFNDDMYEAEIVLPPNTYDIFASSHEYEKIRILTKEEIEVVDFKTINLDFIHAENKVVYNGVDEFGNQLENAHKQFILFPPATTPFISASYSFPYDTLYFSDISDRYHLSFSESSANLEIEQKIRVIHHLVLEGISNNQLLKNDPNNFLNRDIEIRISYDNGELLLYNDGIMRRDFSRVGGFPIYGAEMDSNIWRGELVLSEFKNDAYRSSLSFIALSSDYQNGFLSPLLLGWDGKILPYSEFKPSADVLLVNSNTPIIFGNSSIYSDAFFLNNYWPEYNFISQLSFFGPNQELLLNMNKNSSLKVIDQNNNLVQSDSNTTQELLMLPEEYFSVEFSSSNYKMHGIDGNLSLVSDFDLSAEDCTPPQITSFKILNQAREIKDHFEKGDSILIYFSSADMEYDLLEYSYTKKYNSINFSKTKMEARLNELEKWKPVETFTILEDSTIGFLYKADLTSYANHDSASIDLQIQFVDMAGNKTDWIIAPAFTVGRMPTITDMKDIEVESITKEYSYKLNANYPNPFNPSTKIRYDIGDTRFVTLKVYNVIGQEVALLVNKEQNAGSYEVEFNAIHLTSGVYFYRLQSGGFVESRKMILLK